MMRRVVLIAGHRREVDSVFGHLQACVVYEPYLERIHEAGAAPLIVSPGRTSTLDVVERVDAVVLIGGGDVDPSRFGSSAAGDAIDVDRDDYEIRLVELCRSRNIPLLAMCRGAQVLNVSLGGTLHEVSGHRQDTALSSASHTVAVRGDGLLEPIFGGGELKVNSFHRWAVDRLGDGMRVAAVSSDDVCEAIESTTEWWAAGIQWHAELLREPHALALFAGFVSVVEQGAN